MHMYGHTHTHTYPLVYHLKAVLILGGSVVVGELFPYYSLNYTVEGVPWGTGEQANDIR